MIYLLMGYIVDKDFIDVLKIVFAKFVRHGAVTTLLLFLNYAVNFDASFPTQWSSFII